MQHHRSQPVSHLLWYIVVVVWHITFQPCYNCRLVYRHPSLLLQNPLRRPDPAGPGAGYASRCAGTVAYHIDVRVHPEMAVEKGGLVGVHLDLRVVHDGARVEDAGDDGVELL